MSSILRGFLCALLLAGCAAAQVPDCPYLPAFQSLRAKLDSAAAAAAVRALEQYRTTHDNPAACEDLEIERPIAARLTTLISLQAGVQKLEPQAVYLCDSIDFKTAHCKGAVIDDSAHPFSAGTPPRTVPSALPWRISSRVHGANISAVYWASYAMLLDAKPATRLTLRAGAIAKQPAAKDFALIVILRGKGSKPFTKAVWYF